MTFNERRLREDLVRQALKRRLKVVNGHMNPVRRRPMNKLSLWVLSTVGLLAVSVCSPEIASAEPITAIDVRFKTANANGAGTDCPVYLGFGGREFNLDRANIDDRERNSTDIYKLGSNSNVSIPGNNDPREGLPLAMEDVSRFPVYIRMSDDCTGSGGHWKVDYAEVRGNPGPAEIVYSRLGALNDDVQLWFSPLTGMILYLLPGTRLVEPVPAPSQCPRDQKCCEPQPTGRCSLCIPLSASCP